MKNTALLIVLLTFLQSLTFGQDITGAWAGKLEIQGMKLPIVFHISADGPGYKSTMDSPSQGAKGIAVEKTEFKAPTLTILMPKSGIAFAGDLNAEGKIVGEFKQSGLVLPLELSKSEGEYVAPTKPQEPKRPLPYREEEVTFENKTDHLTLAGTLTLPEKGKKFPAIILITGSGPQNRDEELLGHKPFLIVSDYLTRQGFAVLRFDERGVGKSSGKYAGATTEDLSRDVLAGLDFLKSRPEIDHKKIGLLGHSEGGIIGPMLAAQNKEVAFVVMVGGPALPGSKILYLQSQLISEVSGASKDELANSGKFQQGMLDIMTSNDDLEKAKKELEAFADQNLDLITQGAQLTPEEHESFVQGQVRGLATPWMHYFLNYDPAPALAKVKVPVLAVYGEKDLQVPPTENIETLKQIMEKSGQKNIEITLLPGLNHLMQTTQTGNPAEYGELDETFSPLALKTIRDWLVKVSK
ncbi:MAG: alpha/beta fold hydrolase [Bacteroidia bacterium]|nr:alpha/beta fold hydrolase [Bacteroidia bacterium]